MGSGDYTTSFSLSTESSNVVGGIPTSFLYWWSSSGMVGGGVLRLSGSSGEFDEGQKNQGHKWKFK
ncbi:succinate dehydrogenase [ubiquinone] iron-sulfur subunit 3 [Pyrus ussuriensis x Pyrus communis]|uniref:Succinate dehydrogenase [ubiquinone] iron-sulfur subunit 3 n=1 Tax=Pyrus ussuriensis x Pyrus communis TaxID=2448454 RepID=A0A5N5HIW9_9ROSA|nr:succinate dehydrogenase [ubiquinone] iron-sulfur subunit 3 [Pyrus ussuriensis x Pyrus communis]